MYKTPKEAQEKANNMNYELIPHGKFRPFWTKKMLPAVRTNPKSDIIKTIKYYCNKKTDVGVCKTDDGLWQHTWRRDNPRYKDGEIVGRVTVTHTGIHDWEYNYEDKNDNKPVRTIGQLMQITYNDGTVKVFHNHSLMTNKAGTRLYVIGENGGAVKPKKVVNDDKTTIYVFHQKGCGACASVLKWIDKVNAKVIKIDCGKDGKTADKFNIKYTPTLIIRKGGKDKRIEGAISYNDFIANL